jgi:prepilin-type N-terminal cleavage/methylation domain-containing protein
MNARSNTRGVTLIELLIVIAMMSIFAAGSLAVVVAPAREHAYASREMLFESGAAAFFSAITNDMHSARTVRALTEPPAVVLEGVAANGGGMAYWVDGAGMLRRAVLTASEAAATTGGATAALTPGRGSVMLEKVTVLDAAPEGGAWRVKLVARASDAGRAMEVSHEVLLLAGTAWTGRAK